jgi:predicted MFS family arabinose efflux permease
MNLLKIPNRPTHNSLSAGNTVNEQLLLFILATIQFTHIMDFMIMMPLGPQLMRLFAISPQQFGLLVSAYTFSAGIFGFAAAFFIDRFDRKKALLFLYLGFSLGTLACALAPGYYLLLLARILTGAFGGILGALVLAIVGDAIPAERRGRAMGIVMASFAIASVAGVPFGLFLANQWEWHAPFFLLAFLSLICCAIAWRVLPPMRAHLINRVQRDPLSVIREVATSANQRWALGLMMMMMLGAFSVIPFLSPYMVSNVGFSESQLAYIYLTGGSVSFFSSILVGRLADKYGKQRVFILANLLSIIPLIILTNMSRTPIAMALLVFALYFIFNNARSVPAMAIITSSISPKTRGSFMSFNSSVQQVSSGIASFLAGLVIHKSASGELVNFNLVGFCAAIIAVASIIFVKRIKPVDTAASPEALELSH